MLLLVDMSSLKMNISNIFFMLFISTILLFGDYNIVYKSITVGRIKDFSTIKNGYLIGKPTNSILKLLTPWDNYIIYQEGKKPNIKGDNKYKKDKHLLLHLINKLSKSQPKYQKFETKKYKLVIRCKDGICNYIRTNKYKNSTTKGYLSFTNNILEELKDYDSHLAFKRVE